MKRSPERVLLALCFERKTFSSQRETFLPGRLACSLLVLRGPRPGFL